MGTLEKIAQLKNEELPHYALRLIEGLEKAIKAGKTGEELSANSFKFVDRMYANRFGQ